MFCFASNTGEEKMIQLTSAARDAVRSAIASSSNPAEGIRIMVEAGGCSGFKYMMGLVSAPESGDLVIDCDGVKVFVDRESSPHLAGTTVDFVVSLEQSGFSFDNPNAASKCSCGKSFN
ncbi:iron-sulfur cluster assembly accessory protein [Acetobacter peroxydans NBRC 13755]|nr:iron-sulfur cluster assembly accessory protein [Acetobacter peroxydans NBRC 13755]